MLFAEWRQSFQDLSVVPAWWSIPFTRFQLGTQRQHPCRHASTVAARRPRVSDDENSPLFNTARDSYDGDNGSLPSAPVTEVYTDFPNDDITEGERSDRLVNLGQWGTHDSPSSFSFGLGSSGEHCSGSDHNNTNDGESTQFVTCIEVPRSRRTQQKSRRVSTSDFHDDDPDDSSNGSGGDVSGDRNGDCRHGYDQERGHKVRTHRGNHGRGRTTANGRTNRDPRWDYSEREGFRYLRGHDTLICNVALLILSKVTTGACTTSTHIRRWSAR